MSHRPDEPTTVVATYRVRPEAEPAFLDLLRRHWPTLRQLELVTEEPPLVLRGEDPGGRPTFLEIFTWKDAEAPEKAHQLPDVMAIWEPMGALTEGRDGKRAMEFPHVERVVL